MLRVDTCLFKVVCLIELSSKHMYEKTIIFTFSLYLVLSVHVNDQPNAFF